MLFRSAEMRRGGGGADWIWGGSDFGVVVSGRERVKRGGWSVRVWGWNVGGDPIVGSWQMDGSD